MSAVFVAQDSCRFSDALPHPPPQGLVIGFLKSFYGMSGSILNVAFYAFFQQPSGCSGLEWGCCADGATDRTDRHGGGCAGVVPFPPLATLSNSSSGGGLGFSSRSSYGSYSGSCQQGLDASGFGCCGNGLTTRVDEAGTNCFGVTLAGRRRLLPALLRRRAAGAGPGHGRRRA